MMYTRFALATALGLAVAVSPSMGQTAEDLKKAIDRLDLATKDLQAAKDALKIEDLRSKSATIESKIDLIDKDIQAIAKDIREIKRKLNDTSSISLRPDTDSATRSVGRVRFVNDFSEEMSVVINDRAYRLLPGQERLVTVAPGDFTYQVLNLQRFAQVRRISADETKTIRIYPLQ